MSKATSKQTIVKNMAKNGRASATKGSATTKGIKKAWTNPKYPNVKGWTRVEHTRGQNDKKAGEHYYTYYPPRGNRKQIRSVARVNARMAADALDAHAPANDVDDDVVVIVPPEKPLPEVVDLTKDEEPTTTKPTTTKPTTTNIMVYGNVTMCVTPGGGYHIKWNE